MSIAPPCPVCGSTDVRLVVAIRRSATSAAAGSQGFRCRRCEHRWRSVSPHRLPVIPSPKGRMRGW
jgi:transposase-like protein